MRARLSAIRNQMATQGIDALVTRNQANVRYATGFRGEPHTLLLTAETAVLYTSFRTLPWAQQQTQPVQSQLELSTSPSPIDDIAKRITSEATNVGVDLTLTHPQFLSFSEKLPSKSLTPCSVIEHTRRYKSPAEIELLIQSQLINESIFNAVIPQIKPGLTERTVQGIILTEIGQREEIDGYSFAPIVAAGGNAWEIHHLPDHTPIKDNDILLLDLGVIYQGYASDMTRTISIGKASSQEHEVYEIVRKAQEAAIAHLKPQAQTHDVDQIARGVITQAGHGKSFTHGLGHSIGLETHDPGLNLSPSTPNEIIAPGMAFTVEPGIYLENAFGVRIEDVIIATPEGNLNITQQPKDLLELHC